MNPPLRTINEVRERLKLEPTIKEIYVEGFFDRDLYRWGLKKLKKATPVIYPIATIDVPTELLVRHGLTSGERQRLLAFAKELADSGDFTKSLLCIVDSDFDYALDVQHVCDVLCGTSGTSAELFFLNFDLLLKFYESVLALESAGERLKLALDVLIPVLRQLFLVRAVNDSLKLGWKIVDIEDELKKEQRFDFEKYMEKIFHKNVGIEKRGVFFEELARIEAKSGALEDHQMIHGHDFVGAIRKNLINLGVKRKMLSDSNEVGRILLGMLEWDSVRDDRIFKKLSSF